MMCYVFLDVVDVVVCVGFVVENHGEVMVLLELVAGWNGNGGVLILVV